MSEPRCVDCLAEGVTTVRPIVSGTRKDALRCATHTRTRRRRVAELAHGRRIVNGYEMPPPVYQRLYEAQGGVCFICRKATGVTKRLAVEHEHNKPGCEHPPERGCPRCWRALTCGRCNKLVAFLDVEALCRAIELLVDPPAQRILCDDLSEAIPPVYTEFVGTELARRVLNDVNTYDRMV